MIQPIQMIRNDSSNPSILYFFCERSEDSVCKAYFFDLADSHLSSGTKI